MGAWGSGVFENDTALDWIAGLKPPKKKLFGLFNKTDPTEYPTEAIQLVLNADFIGSSTCEEGLAAAECFAALGGHPAPNLPDEIRDWVSTVKGLPTDEDFNQWAAEAVWRIQDAEESELRQLWVESSEDGKPDPQWYASLDDLAKRLTS
ncbi:hypothetical protein COB72_04060 [bacterium]|nr:MAG: hypothetical protein COB72_04060 [bacterium]